MSDFMQRQYDVSQQLISAMVKDAEYNRQLSDLRAHYESLLQERDRKIAKLESTLEAMHVLQGS